MRIEDPKGLSSQISLWVGVLVVIGVGFGAYKFFSQSAPERDPNGPPYLKLVPTNAKLRSRLSDAQYHVTRENGTETAFKNQFWNNFRPGLYVDVITGDPLFSSQEKFDSQTGRPSFTKPVSAECVFQKPDTSFNMNRIEIRAKKSDSHLGHLFNDGPPPSGLRYAINSAALRFIPLEEMQAQGYGEFLPLVSPPGATAPPAPAGK